MKTKQILFFIALLLVFTINAQNIITVDNTPGNEAADYDDLLEAISGASPGDTIYVHSSSNSYGDITVDKELHLRGYSHSDDNKVTYIESIEFGENASDSSFKSLHITGNVLVDNLNTALTGLVFENNIIEGTMSFRDAGVGFMTIRGNVVGYIGSSGNGISSEFFQTIISNNIITDIVSVKYYDTVTIENNIFYYDSGNYVIRNLDSGNGTITVQNNIIYPTYSNNNIDINSNGVLFDHCWSYNNGSGSMAPLDGSNNTVNVDPLFVSADDSIFDAYLDDYHLQAGSTAIGAGAGGADVGIYWGSFEFNNIGFTNNLPTVKITAMPNTVNQGATINVIIETKAN